MIKQGDCLEVLKTLPGASVHCCVTSPPYFGLRDYGHAGQIGLEETPDAYVAKMVAVFREVNRVLRDDGSVWLNLGDSYDGSGKGRNADGTHSVGGKQDTNAGSHEGLGFKTNTPDCKPKNLIGIPWRVAFALQADGWYLRQDIIWHKPNPMPESVTDRCTKAHEYIFLLAKSRRYYYDAEAVKEESGEWNSSKGFNKNGQSKRNIENRIGNRDDKEQTGRNKRSVWTVATTPYSEAHFATFPPDLIKPCILAGCPKGGTVLDPFSGAGTTGVVAKQHERDYIGIELNPEYVEMSEKRIARTVCQPQLF